MTSIRTLIILDFDPETNIFGGILAEEGIKRCTRTYIAQNRDTPILTEATVDQLDRTIKNM